MSEKLPNEAIAVGEYSDAIHAEVLDDLQIGEYNYKFRLLDGVVVPPYVTPKRYALSRCITTRIGDVCYISFPKSGSTWLAYLLVLLMNRGQTPNNGTLRNSLHWVESSWTYPRTREELDAILTPRIFKSHMPYQMALGGDPEKNPCKYIYIARNPKDVVVSYYIFESGKSWSGFYSGPWAHWLEMFLEGKVQRGDWFNHVLSWWEHRHAPNILFLKYEDLVRNLPQELAKIEKYLGYTLDAETRELIVSKVQFETMREDQFAGMKEIKEFNSFFRKGHIGSWKELFTPAQSEMFDKVYAERMKGSGLVFDFD